MQYVVIKTGGKQYLVAPGDILEVEKIKGKEGSPRFGEAGDTVSFEEVLLKVDEKKVEIGKPFIKNAKVEAEILEQIKDKKVRGVKYQRIGQRTRFGHRQKLTRIQIAKVG